MLLSWLPNSAIASTLKSLESNYTVLRRKYSNNYVVNHCSAISSRLATNKCCSQQPANKSLAEPVVANNQSSQLLRPYWLA
jgi:hypothetical protein